MRDIFYLIFSSALRFLQEDFVLLIPSASLYFLIQFGYQLILKLQG